MANARNGNTYYIDTQFATTEELAVRNLKLVYVVLTVTGAGGRVVLSDSSLATKLDLRIATDEQSEMFDFSENPIVFSTSIRPTTLTTAIVTCVFQETRA